MNPDAYVEMAETEQRHWWYVGRRAVLKSVIGGFGLPPDARILEIGAGTGGNLRMLSAFGTVSAVEMDDGARAIAVRETNGEFDIRAGCCPDQLPFEHEQFDLICLFDVLEHIDDDVATLAAIKTKLSPKGRVVLTVPAFQYLWSAHDEFLHHKRRYSALELRSKMERAAFRIQRLTYYNTLLFPLAAAARLKQRVVRPLPIHGRDVPVAPINRVLTAMFSAERYVIPRIDLPFGVSLLAILTL